MVKKIVVRIKLVSFILFKKNNFLRNFLLHPVHFKNVSNLKMDLDHDLIDLLRNINNLKESKLKYYKTKAFNSQIKRTEIISSILKEFKPATIFETGTFLGSTTEYLSNFAEKVISIERSELYFLFSSARLQNLENIELVNGDSGEYLSKTSFDDQFYFFYLDAHWGSGLPLKKELEIIFNIKNFIICIDDFKVPDNQDWGYDKFFDKELSIEGFDFILNKSVFFPTYNLENETGPKRGCVFISSDGFAEDVLSNQSTIQNYYDF